MRVAWRRELVHMWLMNQRGGVGDSAHLGALRWLGASLSVRDMVSPFRGRRSATLTGVHRRTQTGL